MTTYIKPGEYISFDMLRRAYEGAPMDKEKLADLFERSADYLEAHGWLRGSLWNPAGACCARGAMLKVTGQESYGATAFFIGRELAQADAYLAKFLGSQGVDGVVAWNNAEERTQYEVIDAFRGAAKELRNGE
jgi:hypothetical protein